jgi:hypothetical protein
MIYATSIEGWICLYLILLGFPAIIIAKLGYFNPIGKHLIKFIRRGKK